MSTKAKAAQKKEKGTVSRAYTVNLGKALYGTTFKDRAPKAVKTIKLFAQKAMNTKDVRIDTKLNTFLWSRGIKSVPKRVRVVLSRKRSEDENAQDQLYTVASLEIVKSFKGLQTAVVNDA
eukprot:gene4235-5301_t